ncbi:ATP synthase subunit g, mitochondrial [Fulvia fulva]|uniref:ATP synthase subunit g, mitochondrial n=1 Tax=Passalora fulva TaxID=5499 RepID=A0A9Q8PII1_PASFU|nr:ATP synthase subunit g, mitochondrial [Fulvia fulva]KAK4627152.1 ATP synthase subunit g, mitochondrial [Fulvia fulva]KAK4628240.1 ATP synthase subunit g, mitochondrial [Fulvia fulva]UJO23044.1 ATP synthase subunit g, mitochondrial [Fulvia fulva]WPV13877.1 ATP synthase subunit g, mitochondrial [Fulvia fulva]WPV28624.1 ATP synthase subunit g, mitochondrial [Fulvia fulva]
MASPLLPRLALRQSSRLLVQRRAASTTSEATQAASKGATAAKETAQSTVSKAQEGLSKVTSSAGPALSKAASSASNAVSNVGGRTGAAINWVQGLIPHVVYYGKVAGELGRIIYTGRGMQPPSTQTVQSYLGQVTNAVRNPASLGSQAAKTAEKSAETVINNPQSFLARVRDLDAATLTTVGVVTAETIGFFSIGEMLGRFKIIGYRSSGSHAEHH